MNEALLVVQFLNAALLAGLNAAEAIDRVSAMVRARHADGATLSAEDLKTLFDAGDVIEADALAQFEATLGA